MLEAVRAQHVFDSRVKEYLRGCEMYDIKWFNSHPFSPFLHMRNGGKGNDYAIRSRGRCSVCKFGAH